MNAARWFDRHCHFLYAAMALPLMIWFSFWIPAFQNPDERDHFARAELISRGVLVGARLGAKESGGWIDSAIDRTFAPYDHLPFNPAAKITGDVIAASRQVRWSGELQLSKFITVVYGPAFYMPQAVGIWIGRRIGLGVVDTLVLSRVVNALVCCALGFVALRLCQCGRRVMFSVLCWPMALSLSASSSQDGLLITSAALMIAVVSRVSSENRPATPRELTMFLIALVGSVTARPPHIAFALLLPLLLRRSTAGASSPAWGQRFALVVAAVLCVAWMVIVRVYTMPVTLLESPDGVEAGRSISGQLAYLKAHPGVVPSLIYRTMVLGWKPLITTAVGVLGWLDTLMPSWYYWLATATFVVALVADRPVASLRSRSMALAGGATLVVFTALTYLSIYLIWMAVGASDVLGVQGRYLLAGLPLTAWVLPARRDPASPRESALGSGAWIALVLFVVVTYVIVPSHVIARYYGP